MLKAYVDFRVPQLFVDEVKAEQLNIEDRVVRVTQLHKRPPGFDSYTNVYVCGTAICREHVLRLTASVGRLVGNEKNDAKIRKEADEMEKQIGEQLVALGMEVRGGYIRAITAEAA